MTVPKLAVNPIPDELIVALTEDADCRRIESGISRLESCNKLLGVFDPSMENAASFLVVLARWCDIVDMGPAPVRMLLAKYDKALLAHLRVCDYVRIRLAQGMVSLKEGMVDAALEAFDIVLKLADETTVPGALALANYWSGRCYRKQGNYDRALTHVRSGREIQLSAGRLQCGASMRVLESMILFAKGESEAAVEELQKAEDVLSQTDDFITLGNIQSTYGGIRQNQDRYRQAMEHYSRALEYFQKRDSLASNVARAGADAAFARIQTLRQLRRSIDIHAGHPHMDIESRHGRTILMKELSKLYEAILSDLDRAAGIYEQQPNVRGIARVHLYRGYLYQAMEEMDRAMREASQAYAFAESKRDIILMSAARHLQCMIEEANVEEEIENWADHALAAQEYARDAVELASATEDRQLLARAHIWFGIVLSNALFNARDRAHEEMQAAAKLLDATAPGHIWEEFRTLKKRLMEHGAVDAKLGQWARGEIREKTFRELEEDFADLVIPIAWQQEGRKVSRVASRFSISPKKVRRVLGRLGYLDNQAETEAEAEENELEVSVKDEVVQSENSRPIRMIRPRSRPASSRLQ
jgi:tetratricopeptide (TPR) repeat protein